MAAVAVAAAVIIIAGRWGGRTSGPADVPRGTVDTVVIAAGEAIQPVVDTHPAGTTFTLEPGVYREQQVTPRPGDVFVGSTGTVLDGARLLDGWTADDHGWWVGGQTQEGTVHGGCRPEAPRCDRPEELFVDGQRLQHVDSLDRVTATSWYFDYEADRIHIGVDPTGRTVATSVTSYAFVGDASAVTIRDLTVTHYATPAQRGAIEAEGPDWLIENVTAVDNHALGVFFTGDRTLVQDSVMRGNGQMGMGGSGAKLARVERVELAGNNQIGFDDEWEAGGAKFTLTQDMVFSDSYVHDNDGAGIWFDESAEDSVITRNRSVDNTGAGIFYEISKGATISDNIVTGNGFGEDSLGWVWGSGIQIAASWDVEVRGNQVSGNRNGVVVIQQDRGSGPLGDRQSDDILVTSNTIDPGSGLIGAATDVAHSDLFERNIHFSDNAYAVPEGVRSFVWNGEKIDSTAWAALGMS